jgi:hypothetical protein
VLEVVDAVDAVNAVNSDELVPILDALVVNVIDAVELVDVSFAVELVPTFDATVVDTKLLEEELTPCVCVMASMFGVVFSIVWDPELDSLLLNSVTDTYKTYTDAERNCK